MIRKTNRRSNALVIVARRMLGLLRVDDSPAGPALHPNRPVLLRLLAAFIASTATPLYALDLGGPQTISFNLYSGAGFQATPGPGQLDSDDWAITGWSDGSLAFGGTRTTGDYARGLGALPVTTGGHYSFDLGASEASFGFQPGGSDFAPGTATLRMTNITGSTLNSVDLTYEIHVRNDQARANSLNFSFSANCSTFTTVPALDFTSPEALAGTSWVQSHRNTTLSGLAVPNGSSFCIRWSSADVSGTGSRDEFALDDIAFSNLVTSGGVDTPPTLAYSPSASSTVNLPSGSLAAVVNTSISTTPSGGSGTGAAATSTVNGCVIVGAGASAFGAVSGQPLSFVGSTTTAQNLGLSCTLAAAAASATLNCNETQGAGAPVVRSWPLNCPAATPDVPPNLAYSPVSSSSVTLSGGSVGATGAASISVTPSDGLGSGAPATTTLDSCAISGAGAGAFGAAPGALSFVGPSTTSASLNLSCTVAASAANASLSCTETRAGNAPVNRTWPLSCPAGTGGFTPIAQIQGTGASSPLSGSVTTEGIVTARKSNAFIIQTPDAEADVTPNSSEAILVFTASAPSASILVGDRVRVTGTILEFIPSSDPNQLPITELTSPTVTELSASNPLPTPISLPVVPAGSAIGTLERLEFMRILAPALNVVAPTAGSVTESSASATSNGVFFVTPSGVPRPRREAGIDAHDPLPAGAPVGVPRFDANQELLRVDSDGQAGVALVNASAGQTIAAGVTGVLDYGFRAYTLLPDAALTLSATISADLAPARVANEFTVASYNFQRFFDNVDDAAIIEPILTTTAFNSRLARASRQIRINMGAPDVIGVVEMENFDTLQAIATQINTDNPTLSYAASLLTGNDIGGIDVGFLVKTSIVVGATPRISVVSVTQFGLSSTYTNPNDGSTPILNDRPPLLLQAIVNFADGTTAPIAVLVNHLRSLNDIGNNTVAGTGTTGANVRAKRRAQAEFLANLVQGRQLSSPNERLILVGDFNAFEVNDGYVDVMGTIIGAPTAAANVTLASADLVNPNLTRLLSSTDYSYSFGGNAQNLDHILVSQGLINNTSARRLEHIRLNTDFPEIDRNNASINTRLSDHDALIGYFTVPSSGTPVVSLSVAPTTVNEVTAPTSATLTATLSSALASNLIITVNYSGTAQASDYSGPLTITINAGDLTGSAPLGAVDDADVEAPETVIVMPAASPGVYTIGTSATLTINSEDGGTMPPNLAFSPVSGSTITLIGGGLLGSGAGASILITPSGGAGSGAAATTLLNTCSISGAAAAQFVNVNGTNLSFVGSTSALQTLPLSCQRGVSVANATLTCSVRPGTATSSTVNFNLTCPAASAAGGNLISINQTNRAYEQSFDMLQSGSFVSFLPDGWRLAENGANADSTYRSSSGGDTAGDTYAYGPGACERALGSLASSNLQSRFGACFVNNTGRTLNTLRLAYTGEHWRRSNSLSDTLEFQYLLNPVAPGVADATGTWIDFNALDFANLSSTVSGSESLDGNAAANRQARGADLSALSLTAGDSLCIRWVDPDLTTTDHGLALDDFSLIAEPGAPPSACSGLCVADTAVTEGNSGTTNAVFNITLSSPAPVGGVLFDVRTAVDSASNFDNDYGYFEQANVLIAEGGLNAQVTVQVNGDTRPEPTERFRLVITNVRGASAGDVIGVATIDTDDPYELWQVQSATDRSPLAGLNIATAQNVVTAVASDGFFMQTPAARSDVNPLTSDAVFVFTGSAPVLAIGNIVNVTGNAQERFCSTQISASGAGNGFTVTGSTTPIAPVQFNANRPSPSNASPSCAAHPDPETANFECFENMLVQVQNGFVQGGNQRLFGLSSPPSIPGTATDPFAEALVTAGGRVFRGPGFVYPGFNPTLGFPDYSAGDAAQVARVAEVPVWGGAANVFELDPDALDLNANQVLYGGQNFQATGVLSYTFDDFELWPTSLTVNPRAYPRTPVPQASNELSVASLNLLRYYQAAGSSITPPRCDGSTGTYNSYSTGAGVAEVARRQAKLARYILDMMKAPDVVGVQEAETLAGLQALATAVNALDPTLGYSAYLVSGNDRSGINPAFLVRDGAGGATARVTGSLITQLGFNQLLTLDSSCLHDRPPLRLRGSFAGQDFTVINNHTRSLINIDAPNEDGARTRQKRLQQATSIRTFVNAELSAFPSRPLLVIGDHNAFQFSDGWVDTIGIIRGIQRPALLASPAALPVDQQLTNAVDLLDPQERYSYLFDNASQVLDHALLSDDAQSAFSGMTFVRNNADAPAQTYALAANACAGLDIQPGAGVTTVNVGSAACTEGLSDHEGFVVRLFGNLPQVALPATASITEGNVGNSTLTIPVSLTGTVPSGVSRVRVPVRVTGGSAQQGTDFTVSQAFVDFTSAGSVNFALTILGDMIVEADETVRLELGQPIDGAGQPVAVGLNLNGQTSTVTIFNDDGLATIVPNLIGGVDRNATAGDFVSQAFSGGEYRFSIEVPANMERVNIEIYDADFGQGGASDPADRALGANFSSANSVRYRVLSPSGSELASLTGTSATPANANGNWLSIANLQNPGAGHYQLRVSLTSALGDTNGYQIRARGTRVLRGGPSAEELSIYTDGYASIGHPASGAVGISSQVFYPYVTRGCSVRTRTFDFDTASTSGSSLALSASNGFAQLIGDAALSEDGAWNSIEGNAFTAIDHANGYGIWSLSIGIEGGGGAANQGTVYLADVSALSGNSAPSTNPAPASFRLYQAQNGAAPVKAALRQRLFHVSGANPPSPGNTGVYRVSLQVANPTNGPVSFDNTRTVRSLVPFGGAVRYFGGAQPSQGSLLSEPTQGNAGELIWNPGEVAAGETAELTYMIEVAPAVAGVLPVTGTFAGNNGTSARFGDESGTQVDFGPLCELSVDTAGGVVPTPVTLAAVRSERQTNGVSIHFTVATQIGVAGYRIYEGTGDLRTPVGRMMAASGDSLTPVEITLNAEIKGPTFYLEVLDINADTQWFGPFMVGTNEGARPDLHAIDWQSLRAEAAAFSANRNTHNANNQRLHFKVERDGVQRVTGAQILALAPGLVGTAASALSLRSGTEEVAFELDSSDSVFSPDDTLWFYGSSLTRARTGNESDSAWLYGKARSYVFGLGAGRLIKPQEVSFNTHEVSSYQRELLVEKQLSYLFSSPSVDPLAAERLLALPGQAASASYVLNLADALPGRASINAEVWGGADFAALDDHHAQLWLGETLLHARRFDGLSAINMSAERNLQGADTLELKVRVPGDNGQNFDLVHVDRLQLSYPARLALLEGQLELPLRSLSDAAQLLRDGFESGASTAATLTVVEADASTRAWLIAAQGQIRLPSRMQAQRLQFALPQAAGDARFVAFKPANAHAPTLKPWLDDSALITGSADYLIVAHPQFVAGLAPLIADKQAQGLQVKTVEVEQIYQRYSAGNADAAAIQAYLRDAHAAFNMRFVLLVGGDSTDARGELNTGSLSFVPTPYRDLHPVVRFAASDSAYADLNGDLQPEFALGRFPVRNAAELAALVNKSLARGNNQRSVLLADDRDAADAFSFADISDRVASALGGTSSKFYLDQMSQSTIRSGLLARVAANDRLVHFFGHSGPSTWTYPAPGILSPSDIFAGALSNATPNLLLQWGCWNSYHVLPSYNTMAHAWLLGPNGAQAVIGAAALTDAANNALLAQALARELRLAPSIGEALQRAKRELAASRPSAIDVLLGVTLLGDPSLPF